MKMRAFWDIAPCSLIGVDRRFRGAYYNETTVRISGESPCGVCRLWCGSGGKCTGERTKGLLLVENIMTHQGVTLLHTD
jgi:hypothetical protein